MMYAESHHVFYKRSARTFEDTFIEPKKNMIYQWISHKWNLIEGNSSSISSNVYHARLLLQRGVRFFGDTRRKHNSNLSKHSSFYTTYPGKMIQRGDTLRELTHRSTFQNDRPWELRHLI